MPPAPRNAKGQTPNARETDRKDPEVEDPDAKNPDEEEEEEPIEGPPDESFDEKYNKHLEFPVSLVGAVLFHVFVGAVIVFALGVLLAGQDKPTVPVKLVNLTGMDEVGEGSAGSGGEEDPFFKANGDPVKALQDSLADPSKLPEVKEDIRQTIKYLDPTGNLPISNANAAAYKGLEESVRKKLLGARQGSGPGKGSGFDGTQGTGPGGTGADSTLGRNMRWVLRFKVSSGRDYLEQLRAMGAELLIPIPGSDKCVLISDLNKESDQRQASDDDLRRMSEKIKFSDSRPEAVRGVSQTLKLDFTPKSFWAFFPKEIEQDLAKKETGYRNRRTEDIEETIFRVTVRGGSYELVVDEQTLKR